ncbi:FMN-dependent dehydrogenase [Protomyces lactucae-debilis]|uniref:FMN-dependent dehydrogenase n=1 Tax=Protomyces lactucae-debilis TaxID=2754530 RepID=A0A1Y2ETB6_PROLT|nr:FMN-dependent dehydrogenase [Protomyces lactucae-debilis]ORY74808.1 FMN-dependent dehydrogenase [Protomyces lactucae-debilis]
MKTAPTNHSEFQRDIYGAFAPPLQPTCPNALEQHAHKVLKEPAWHYINGSAALGLTAKANREAFDRYPLVPRMLRDVTTRSTRVTLFGKTYDSPILAAPVGVQQIAHADGEIASARGAAAQNVPFICSTASTRTLEEVADACGTNEHWYQLYWPKSDEVCISLLERAQKAGYTTLVVTLDTFVLGWRSRDLDTAYLPFLYGLGTQIGLTDPVFNAKFEQEPAPGFADLKLLLSKARGPLHLAKLLYYAKTIRKARAWLGEMNSETFKSWEQLKLIRAHWPSKILLKGVQHVEDAALAIEYGMDGLCVSNHGGRQVSGAIASLDALNNICQDKRVQEAVKQGFTLLFDSGIRTGSDILKALAIGAHGVLVGRPYIYGLSLNGQAGVEHVFQCLKADLEISMVSAGVKELTREELDKVVGWSKPQQAAHL